MTDGAEVELAYHSLDLLNIFIFLLAEIVKTEILTFHQHANTLCYVGFAAPQWIYNVSYLG